MHSLFSMSKLQGGIGKELVLLFFIWICQKKPLPEETWSLASWAFLLPVSWLSVVMSKCCTKAVSLLPSLCWLAPLPQVCCIQILILCRSPKHCKGIQLQKACSLKICSNSCCCGPYQILWSSGSGRRFSASGRWIFSLEESGNEQKNVKGGEVT